ncbi:hypothetical protein RJD11_09835 [Bacillus velezensis]|nr:MULTISPECIES: hypothetical protein [Bacillus amyloliquefaciens group]MBV2197574.1 hypothetical protein [Bacillus velezensis]MDJ1631387.1 hypothetical protein [Bacillus velezensis]QXP98972.1 hypothetical protein KVY05_09750 [Bacillus velezensis]UHH04800.1 hypothetical protein LUA14_09795 [Bacillus amyloliquefaciens]ULR24527.1 hypothetical protein MJE83_09795 [Bacillus velezensis]
MTTYYCNKCKKVCAREEVELEEDSWEGDWQEVHLACGEKVIWFLIEKE